MSKEVKRYVPEYCESGGEIWAEMQEDNEGGWVRATDYDALLAELDALKAEQALWAPIHYEVHRRAEKEWCLSSGCDFTVTVMHEDYAAIDSAMLGEQL